MEQQFCDYCGKYRTIEGHDSCLGELIGVANACCGHGKNNEAYIQFLDGTAIRGEDAIIVQNILKKNSVQYNDMNATKREKLKFLVNDVKYYKQEWGLLNEDI